MPDRDEREIVYEYLPNEAAVNKTGLMLTSGLLVFLLCIGIGFLIVAIARRGDDDGQAPTVQASADDAKAAVSAAITVTACLWIALVVGIAAAQIYMVVWVIKDSRNRGLGDPAVWAIVLFTTSIVGLLVYIASRPQGVLVICHDCGNPRLEFARQCPHCGLRIRKAVIN